MQNSRETVRQNAFDPVQLPQVPPVGHLHVNADLLGRVDDLRIGCALALRTRLRTIGANQLLANRPANLLRKITRPATGLGLLADGGVAHAVLAADFADGELAGAEVTLDQIPIRLWLPGHFVPTIILRTLSLSARALSAMWTAISLARVAPVRMSPRAIALRLALAESRA